MHKYQMHTDRKSRKGMEGLGSRTAVDDEDFMEVSEKVNLRSGDAIFFTRRLVGMWVNLMAKEVKEEMLHGKHHCVDERDGE